MGDPDRDMPVLLSEVPWARLAPADAREPVGNVVAEQLAALVRSPDRECRLRAAGDLYCSLSNQGVAGQVTPHATRVLVTALRRGLPRDRDVVYGVLQGVMECQAWNVQEQAEGLSLIVAARREVVAGLDIYLSDIDGLGADERPEFVSFLNEIVGRYPVILSRVQSVMRGDEPRAPDWLSVAYLELLEHVEEHQRDPMSCFCGAKYWELLAPQ